MIGGTLVFAPFVTKDNTLFLAGALAMSAGVMLMVSLGEIFGQAVAEFEMGGHSKGDAMLFAVLTWAAGFTAVALLDTALHGLEHAGTFAQWITNMEASAVGQWRNACDTTRAVLHRVMPGLVRAPVGRATPYEDDAAPTDADEDDDGDEHVRHNPISASKNSMAERVKTMSGGPPSIPVGLAPGIVSIVKANSSRQPQSPSSRDTITSVSIGDSDDAVCDPQGESGSPDDNGDADGPSVRENGNKRHQHKQQQHSGDDVAYVESGARASSSRSLLASDSSSSSVNTPLELESGSGETPTANRSREAATVEKPGKKRDETAVEKAKKRKQAGTVDDDADGQLQHVVDFGSSRSNSARRAVAPISTSHHSSGDSGSNSELNTLGLVAGIAIVAHSIPEGVTTFLAAWSGTVRAAFHSFQDCRNLEWRAHDDSVKTLLYLFFAATKLCVS